MVGTAVAHAEEPAFDLPQEAALRPPFGLPPGWKSVQKAYKSGASEGKAYQRFTTPDGQGNYCSISACVRAHAAMNGNDPDAAVAEYKRLRDELQGERCKAKEQAKLRAEQAGEAFRARYGLLDGATLAEMPGWRVESYFLASCGQTHKKFVDPTGQAWRLLKDVEAVLGTRLLDEGEAALDAEVAAARRKAEVKEAHGGTKRAGPATKEVDERAKFLRAMGASARATESASAPASQEMSREEEARAVTDDYAVLDEAVVQPEGDELLAMLDRGSQRAREAKAASSRAKAPSQAAAAPCTPTSGPEAQEAALAKLEALQAEMDRLREQLAATPPRNSAAAACAERSATKAAGGRRGKQGPSRCAKGS